MKAFVLKITFLFILVISHVEAQQPNFEWVHQLAGTKSKGNVKADIGRKVYVDKDGNIYSTGDFKGTMDADPGPETFIIGGAADNNIYIIKLNSSGDLQWAVSYGNEKYSQSTGVAVDERGNAYVVGDYTGTLDFDPGVAVHEMATRSTASFVLKLNANGEFLWVTQTEVIATSIAIDQQGNVYTAGYFGGIIDFDPGADEFVYMPEDEEALDALFWYSNGFLSKLDSNGKFLWAKPIQGNNDVYVHALVIDSTGDVYIAGDFKGKLKYADLQSPNDNFHSFIIKSDSQGNLIRASTLNISNGGSASISALAVDKNNNVIIAGGFSGTLSIHDTVYSTPSGKGNFLILKSDPAGNYIWETFIGPLQTGIIRSIAIDNLNDIYITGHFIGSMFFEPDNSSDKFVSKDNDSFIEKLYSTGNFAWAKHLQGDYQEYSTSIAIDAQANIFVTGAFGGTVDFDFGPGKHELQEVTEDLGQCDGDAFLLKMHQYLLLAPTNLSVSQTNTGEKLFTWQDNSHNETGFIVEKSINGVNWITAGTVAANITSFEDSISKDVSYSYKVSAFNENGKSDFSRYSESSTTSVNNDENSFYSAFYPNPTTGNTFIQNPFRNSQNIHIEIFTLEGNLLKEFSSMPEAKMHIDLTHQPQGTYLLKLTSGGESLITKVNVVR